MDHNNNNNNNAELPLLVVDSSQHYQYQIIGRIGAGSGGNPVYKAKETMIWPDGSVFEFSNTVLMRNAKSNDDEALKNLQESRIRGFYDKGYYWISFSYMQHGSLLTLISKRFRRGFPESLIAFLLFHIIERVARIHGGGRSTHRAVSAAHAYVNADTHEILLVYLGHGCKMYDLDIDDRWAASVSRWGAAPEVYGKSDNEYGQPADIWLIGITALELAYGGIQVTSRDDLLSLVRDIQRKNRLPERVNGDGCHSWGGGIFRRKAAAAADFVSGCVTPAKRATHDEFRFMPEKRVFSRRLEGLVMACLDFEPSKRPSAESLLRRKIFGNVTSQMPKDCYRFFYGDLSSYC